MNKSTILLLLILIGLTYYYYQNQAELKDHPTVQELKSQLNYYQNLARAKVQEYCGNHHSHLIPAYQQKITDLENSLLSLAKQKIKGQKEASELLTKLESNWQQDKKTWEQQQAQLEQEWKQKRAENKKHWTAQERQWQKERQTLTAQLTNWQDRDQRQQTQLQNLREQNQQLHQELQAKTQWGAQHLPQLKQELFAASQQAFTQLQDKIDQAYFVKGKSEVKEQCERLAQFFS